MTTTTEAPVRVGDVFYAIWGYDQTNVDYYQVVELNGATMVTLRKIGEDREASAWMQGYSTPKPGKFVGGPIRRKVSGDGVSIDSVRAATLFKPTGVIDGVKIFKPTHWTSYA